MVFFPIVNRATFFVVTFSLFFTQNYAVAQGIEVDPNAPVQNRPSMTEAQNTVPVVNIAAPNKGGLSHNKFLQYNVGKKGVILNNSKHMKRSRLGGYLIGNPHLKNGEAKAILNEVTGRTPSSLKGYQEVHGKAADVILVNANGITCDGCGFINTPQATLSTGSPVVGADGKISYLSIDKGSIFIGGGGIDAKNSNILNILARNVDIRGVVEGADKVDIDVITGRNEYYLATRKYKKKAADGSRPPVFAISSSALGGFYGNNVRLVSTEEGIGVNLKGRAVGSMNDLVVTADGTLFFGERDRKDIPEKSNIQAKGNVTFTAKNIVAGGRKIQADGKITLKASSDSVTLSHVVLDAEGDLGVNAKSLFAKDTSLLTRSTGNILLTVTDILSLQSNSTVQSSKNLTIKDANALVMENASLLTGAGGDITLAVAGDIALKSNSRVQSGKNLTIKDANALVMENASLLTGAGGDITLAVAGDIALKSNSTVQSGKNLTIKDANALVMENASLLTGAGGDITLAVAGDIALKSNSTVQSGKNLTIKDANALVMENASLLTGAGGDITLAVAGDIALKSNSTVQSGKGVTLGAEMLRVYDSASIQSSGQMSMHIANVSNLGKIHADRNLHLVAKNGIYNSGKGMIASKGDIDASAYHIINNSAILSNGSAIFTVGRTMHNYGGEIVSRNLLKINKNGNGVSVVNESVGKKGALLQSLEGNVEILADTVKNIRTNTVKIAFKTETQTKGKYSHNGKELTVKEECGDPTDFSLGKSCTTSVVSKTPYLVSANLAPMPQIIAKNDMTIEVTKLLLNKTGLLSAGNDITIKGNYTADVKNEGILGRKTTKFTEVLYKKGKELDHLGKYEFCASRHTMGTKGQGNEGWCFVVGWIGIPGFSWPKKLYKKDIVKNSQKKVEDIIFVRSIIEAGGKVKYEGVRDLDNTSKLKTSNTGKNKQDFFAALNRKTQKIETQTPDKINGVSFDLPKRTGLFKRAKPNAKYLIETNPLFISKKTLLGSDYLLKQMGFSHGTRLGDAAYEQRFIKQQLRNMVGTSKHFSYESFEDRFQIMMNTAVTFAKENDLRVGEALTEEQVGKLKKDIVWLVKKTVGSTEVLVPVVYLAKSTKRYDSNGSIIFARNVDIKSKIFKNSGLLYGEETATVDTQENIENTRGNIGGGKVTLVSKNGDIINRGGTVKSKEKLIVDAKNGRVKNESVVHKDCTEKNIYSCNDSLVQSSIQAGGELVLKGKAGIEVTGAKVSSGGKATIKTDGDLTIKAIKGNSRNYDIAGSVSTNDLYYKFSNTTQEKLYKSALDIKGSLDVDVGNKMKLQGSTIKAKSAKIKAKSVELATEKTKATNSMQEQKVHDEGVNYEERKVTKKYNANMVNGSSIDIDGDLAINADDSVDITSSKIQAKGTLKIKATDINIKTEKSDISMESTDHRFSKGFYSGKSADPKSGKITYSAGYKYSDVKTTDTKRLGIHSTSSISGGTVILHATNKIYSKGGQVKAKDDLLVHGEKGVSTEEAIDTVYQNFTREEETIDLSAKVDLAAPETRDTGKKPTKGGKHRQNAHSAKSFVNTIKDAPFSLTKSIGGGIGISYSKNSYKTESNSQQARKSVFSSGGETKITSFGEVRLKGTDIAGDNGVQISGKRVSLLAAEEKNTSTASKKSANFSVNAGVSLSPVPDLAISFGESNSSSSVRYTRRIGNRLISKNGSISIGSMELDKRINPEGKKISTPDAIQLDGVEMDAGTDINLKGGSVAINAIKDDYVQDNKSKSWQLSASTQDLIGPSIESLDNFANISKSSSLYKSKAKLFSYTASESNRQRDIYTGSSLKSKGNINITSTVGDITYAATQMDAGGSIVETAKGKILEQEVHDKDETTSTNTTVSVDVGVKLGETGTSVGYSNNGNVDVMDAGATHNNSFNTARVLSDYVRTRIEDKDGNDNATAINAKGELNHGKMADAVKVGAGLFFKLLHKDKRKALLDSGIPIQRGKGVKGNIKGTLQSLNPKIYMGMQYSKNKKTTIDRTAKVSRRKAGKSIVMKADSITLVGAKLEAEGGNVEITAKKDVKYLAAKNTRETRSNETKVDASVDWEIQNVGADVRASGSNTIHNTKRQQEVAGIITAKGNVIIKSTGGDITLKGTNIGKKETINGKETIHTPKQIKIIAEKGDVQIQALEDKFTETYDKKGGGGRLRVTKTGGAGFGVQASTENKNIESIKRTGASLLAKDNIFIHAGVKKNEKGDAILTENKEKGVLTLEGVKLETTKSGGGIDLDAAKDVKDLAIKNEYKEQGQKFHLKVHADLRKDVVKATGGKNSSVGASFNVKDEKMHNTTSIRTGSSIKSAGKLSIRARRGGFRKEGGSLEAQGNIKLKAKKKVEIVAAYDEKDSKVDNFNLGLNLGLGKSKNPNSNGKSRNMQLGVKVGYKSDKIDSRLGSAVNIASSSGGLTIESEDEDIILEGSKVDVKKDANFKAENGKIEYQAVKNTYKRKLTSVSLGVSALGSQNRANKKYYRKKYNGGEAGNTPMDEGDQNVNTAMDKELSFSFNYGKEDSDITRRLGGSIKAGGKVNFNAKNDIMLEGTDVDAADFTADSSQGHIKLLAAKSTYKVDKKNVGFSFVGESSPEEERSADRDGNTKSPGKVKRLKTNALASNRLSITGGFSSKKDNSTLYDRVKIKVKKTANIITTKDFIQKGAKIEAKDANVDVKGDHKVVSVIDIKKGHSKGKSFTFSVSPKLKEAMDLHKRRKNTKKSKKRETAEQNLAKANGKSITELAKRKENEGKLETVYSFESHIKDLNKKHAENERKLQKYSKKKEKKERKLTRTKRKLLSARDEGNIQEYQKLQKGKNSLEKAVAKTTQNIERKQRDLNNTSNELSGIKAEARTALAIDLPSVLEREKQRKVRKRNRLNEDIEKQEQKVSSIKQRKKDQGSQKVEEKLNRYQQKIDTSRQTLATINEKKNESTNKGQKALLAVDEKIQKEIVKRKERKTTKAQRKLNKEREKLFSANRASAGIRKKIVKRMEKKTKLRRAQEKLHESSRRVKEQEEEAAQIRKNQRYKNLAKRYGNRKSSHKPNRQVSEQDVKLTLYRQGGGVVPERPRESTQDSSIVGQESSRANRRDTQKEKVAKIEENIARTKHLEKLYGEQGKLDALKDKKLALVTRGAEKHWRAEKKRDKAQGTLSSLRENKTRNDSDIQAQEEKVESLKNNQSTTEQQLSEAETTLKALNKKNDKNNKEITRKEKEIAFWNKKIERPVGTQGKLSNVQGKLSSLRENKTGNDKDIQDQNATVESLKNNQSTTEQQLNEAETTLKALNKERDKNNKEIQNQKKKEKSLKKKIKELQDAPVRLAKAEEELGTVKAKIRALRETRNDSSKLKKPVLSIKIQHQERKEASLEHEIEKYRDAPERLDKGDNKRKTEGDISNLETIIQNQKNVIKKRQKKKEKSLEKLEKKIKGLQDVPVRLVVVQEELGRLRENRTQNTRNIQVQKDKIALLKGDPESTRERLNQEKRELRELKKNKGENKKEIQNQEKEETSLYKQIKSSRKNQDTLYYEAKGGLDKSKEKKAQKFQEELYGATGRLDELKAKKAQNEEKIKTIVENQGKLEENDFSKRRLNGKLQEHRSDRDKYKRRLERIRLEIAMAKRAGDTAKEVRLENKHGYYTGKKLTAISNVANTQKKLSRKEQEYEQLRSAVTKDPQNLVLPFLEREKKKLEKERVTLLKDLNVASVEQKKAKRYLKDRKRRERNENNASMVSDGLIVAGEAIVNTGFGFENRHSEIDSATIDEVSGIETEGKLEYKVEGTTTLGEKITQDGEEYNAVGVIGSKTDDMDMATKKLKILQGDFKGRDYKKDAGSNGGFGVKSDDSLEKISGASPTDATRFGAGGSSIDKESKGTITARNTLGKGTVIIDGKERETIKANRDMQDVQNKESKEYEKHDHKGFIRNVKSGLENLRKLTKKQGILDDFRKDVKKTEQTDEKRRRALTQDVKNAQEAEEKTKQDIEAPLKNAFEKISKDDKDRGIKELEELIQKVENAENKQELQKILKDIKGARPKDKMQSIIKLEELRAKVGNEKDKKQLEEILKQILEGVHTVIQSPSTVKRQ